MHAVAAAIHYAHQHGVLHRDLKLSKGEDLHRYLAGEPVAARPVGWWRQRGRWLRKHPVRAALSLAGIVVAAGLLTEIEFQSIQLQEGIGKTRAARIEADAHHAAMEVAQAQAEHLQTDAAADHRRAREALYVPDLRLADITRQTGDSLQFAQLLDRQIPGPGEADVRGFEWFVLDRMRRDGSTPLELRTLEEPAGPDAHWPSRPTAATWPCPASPACVCGTSGQASWNVRWVAPPRPPITSPSLPMAAG